jgi:hypothetical protein
MRQEPEEQRERGAEQEACNDREIKRGVFAAMNDVARETAEAQGKFPAEVKKSADNREQGTKEEKSPAEFAKRFHNRILPQAAYKSFQNCSMLYIQYT